MPDRIIAHTDGSFLQSERAGGWASVLDGPGGRRVISGNERAADSYDMELRAIIETVKAADGPVLIFSDHMGIVSTALQGRIPLKCRTLWAELYKALKDAPHAVEFVWIKGEQCEEHRLAHKTARQEAGRVR